MGRADNENLGIAFALVIGAGAATGLGAAVVFVPALVRLASRRTLASALGLSAGVMTYVSFVEIFAKSSTAFEDAGYDPDKAYIYSTLCFFAGVILMVLLNQTVTWLLGGHHHHHHSNAHEHDYHHRGDNETGRLSSQTNNINNTFDPQSDGVTADVDHNEEVKQQEHEATTSHNSTAAAATTIATRHRSEEEHDESTLLPCCAEDPAGNLQHLQKMATEIENFEAREHHHWEGAQHTTSSTNRPHQHPHDQDGAASIDKDEEEDESTGNHNNNNNSSNNTNSNNGREDAEQKKLMRMSLNTALAIGLHNFPEGLATFVAALGDPSVGAVLAVAIAIHNVPEGLCVAMPIYYATGNKLKAFGWAMVSGIAEPIAALLGWAVLANSFSNLSYGILFGLVAGMMVVISARELLPTAHRYDPEDAVVTYSFMAGMAIMAVSLVLFLL